MLPARSVLSTLLMRPQKHEVFSGQSTNQPSGSKCRTSNLIPRAHKKRELTPPSCPLMPTLTYMECTRVGAHTHIDKK